MYDGTFEVDEAVNGDDALKKHTESHYRIIFCDIKMPLTDGLMFLENLRFKNDDTYFVIISGYKEFEYAQRAIGLKVFDYLLKPIDEQSV